jgi:hypothetical protein
MRGAVHPRLRAEFTLPAQFDTARPASPERLLMLAVLEDALSIYRKYACVSGRKHRRLVAQTEQWLFSDDTDSPFSFVNLCHALGIDVAWLRSRAAAPAATDGASRPVASDLRPPPGTATVPSRRMGNLLARA